MAACGTGVGCLAGAPAIAGGAMLTTHAAGMGVAASISLMQGAGDRRGGTRTDSKTLYNNDGVRIDVENPAPNRRPGQVHVQLGREKYIYDPATQSFKNAPPRIQRLLEREEIQQAIEKGLRYLGYEPE
jgi:filamentous hemagglutinin